jgi:hypothetical protein
MAQLSATARTEAIIRAGRQFTAFEGRFSVYGAFKAYLDMARLLLPKEEVESNKSNANAVPLYFPVLTKQTLTVITARACAITGSNPVSAKPTISKITRGFEISVYPKVSDNNLISLEQQYANGVMNGMRSVLVNLDTYAAAQLETNKSAVNATVGLPGLTASAGGYTLTYDKRNRLYYYVPSIAARNDLNGVLLNIASTESRELMLEYEAMGKYNNEDMRGVLEGDLPSATGMRHYTSNRIENDTDPAVAETHYLVQNGSIGVFTANDSDAVNRRTSDNLKSYLQTDPIMGIRWDVQESDVCEDLTGTYGAGFERTYGTKYQFAADFFFVHAYSSDTSKPIVKLELLAEA